MAIVLKSETPDDKGSAARDVTGLAGFNLSDLADEGRTRLEQCRLQIQQMLDAANQEAQQLREQAKEEGYREGLEKAAVDHDARLQQEAEQRASEGLRLITNAVQQLHATHQRWMEAYAESLTSIALEAAQRIVQRQLEREPELVVQWAEDALRSTRSATSLTLAVHPETLAQLGRSFDQLLASPDLPEKTHVEPDESVQPNAVVVRQAGGEINAGLHAQLERLEELLA